MTVAFRNTALPVGIIPLNDRTLTPLAQLFIDNVRVLAKTLTKS